MISMLKTRFENLIEKGREIMKGLNKGDNNNETLDNEVKEKERRI